MDTKQPKPSRFEIEHKYLKAIAAVDEKLETFIKQHANFTDEKVSAFVEQCEKEKSQITDKYLTDVAESDDSTPPPVSKMTQGQGNLGDYD